MTTWKFTVFKRAELDMEHPPGQIVTPVTDQTLGDYIKRKEAAINKESKKMAFDEWWENWETGYVIQKSAAQVVWIAAQENK
jgi:hypothetical protein